MASSDPINSYHFGTVSDLDKSNKLLDDPKLADRVATITGRLVTEAIAMDPATANWDWSVAIIDDPETVNAWCMAGGRMAVYTGPFQKLKLTDAEFAQIIPNWPCCGTSGPRSTRSASGTGWMLARR